MINAWGKKPWGVVVCLSHKMFVNHVNFGLMVKPAGFLHLVLAGSVPTPQFSAGQ
jgi:hypothetical protein